MKEEREKMREEREKRRDERGGCPPRQDRSYGANGTGKASKRSHHA